MIDHGRVVHKEGTIIGGIFAPTDGSKEIIDSAFVSFSPSYVHTNLYTGWYDTEQLEPFWVESVEAYILHYEPSEQ